MARRRPSGFYSVTLALVAAALGGLMLLAEPLSRIGATELRTIEQPTQGAKALHSAEPISRRTSLALTSPTPSPRRHPWPQPTPRPSPLASFRSEPPYGRITGRLPPSSSGASAGAALSPRQDVRGDDMPMRGAGWTAEDSATLRVECGLPPLSGSRAQVAASIAVHPPRFHFVARFLEQRAACPGALEALSIYVVFSDDGDLRKFKEMIGDFAPMVVRCMGVSWTPLIADVPQSVRKMQDAGQQQVFAAWKKWFGIVHLMDLSPDEAPEYGLMLDSEIQLFDPADCEVNGRWSTLLERLHAYEASKEWPAARVGANLSCYDFAHGRRMCGQQYDHRIMAITANHVTRNGLSGCKTAGCLELKRQLTFVLFSWWTDIPYVNLSTAARMIAYLAGGANAQQAMSATLRWTPSWRHLAQRTTFTRFEHVEYQQWCALHEGFRFRDVTNLTGLASWGSYMEDPLPGARIVDLKPLWVSSNAYVRALRGTIPDLRPANPLLVFHVDHREGFLDLVKLSEHPRILGYKAKFGVP